MAIQKTITNRSGIEVSYWKIVRTEINWKDRTSQVALYGYTNQEARLAGLEPADSRVFNWSDSNFPFAFEGNNVAQAYEKIVESVLNEAQEETNEFFGAIDC